MKKILVVGSLNMDMVTKVALTPKVGQTVAGQGLDLIPGGKGANQAVALGKLGGHVELIGALGEDANGLILQKNLQAMGVVHNRLKIMEGTATGLAMIMVNESGDNSIVVIPGANGCLRPEDVKKEWFEDAEMVVCQLETPLETVERVLSLAKQLGVQTILNPAPARELTPSLLSNVDLLIPNETEFEFLTGIRIEAKEDILKGYDHLNKAGVKEVIVTLGEKGACYYNGDFFLQVAAQKVKVVDTTAAGDSFIAGLCDALARGASIEDALRMGTKVAAVTVTRFGAQSSLPLRKELQ